MITLQAGQPVKLCPDYMVEVGGEYEATALVPCVLAPGADLGDPTREGYEPPPASRTFFAYYIVGMDPGSAR